MLSVERVAALTSRLWQVAGPVEFGSAQLIDGKDSEAHRRQQWGQPRLGQQNWEDNEHLHDMNAFGCLRCMGHGSQLCCSLESSAQYHQGQLQVGAQARGVYKDQGPPPQRQLSAMQP